MSDPTGGGDLVTRIRVERQGAENITRTRDELAQLNQTITGMSGTLGRAAAQSQTSAQSFATMSGTMGQAASRTTTALTAVGPAAIAGTRGMTMLRAGLTGLAMQATGTAGPVGRLATGVLQFAGGGPLVLGVAGGIAIIGVAYKLMGMEAAQAKAETDAMLKSMAAIGPLAAQHAERLKRRQEITEIDAEITKTRTEGPVQLAFKYPLAYLPGGGGREAIIVDLETRKATLLNEEARAQTTLTAELEKQTAELAKQHMLLTLMFRTTGGIGGGTTGVKGPGALILPTSITTGGDSGLRGLQGPRGARMAVASPLEPMEDAINSVGETSSKMAVTVVDSFSSMAQAAITGSDQMASAVIGAMANIVQALPGVDPLTGTIIGAVAGIFGALTGGGRKPTPVKVTNFEDLRGREVGLERTRTIILDSRGNVLQDLREAEDHDAVIRVGGPVGATG